MPITLPGPPGVLVPTRCMCALSKCVPHCFQQLHWCVACAESYGDAKDSRSLLTQTHLKCQNVSCINLPFTKTPDPAMAFCQKNFQSI